MASRHALAVSWYRGPAAGGSRDLQELRELQAEPLVHGAFLSASEGTVNISLARGKMACGQGDFLFL